MDEAARFYRTRLGENWHRRYGRRSDDPARLTVYGSILTLAAAACYGGVLLALHRMSPGAIAAIAGIAFAGIVTSQALNRHFRGLERAAFADLDNAPGAAALSAARRSVFYPLAKLAMRRRVAFKQAWVEKRMADFEARQGERSRQAEIFDRGIIGLGTR